MAIGFCGFRHPMENDLKELTSLLMKVLAKYEAHIAKGTAAELLEVHKNIINGILEKIKGIPVKPASTALRIGSQLPGPTSPQNAPKPQVVHGAPDDNSAGDAPARVETVPVVESHDVRPPATVESVTPENIDTLADQLTDHDSPAEPVIETMKPAPKLTP